MPGIIGNAMQQNQAQAPGGKLPPHKPANPQDVQRVVIAATKAIHEQALSQRLIQLMKAAGNPVKAIAQATLTVMQGIWEKSRGTIPPEALFPAGVQVAQLVGELAQAAKLFQVTPQLIKAAVRMAVMMFAKQPDSQPAAQLAAQPAPGV